MSTEKLEQALRGVECEVSEALAEIERVVDSPSIEDVVHEDVVKARLAVVLVGALRRLVCEATPEALHRAFGAPGDFGYETPLGAALSELYHQPSGRSLAGARECSVCHTRAEVPYLCAACHHTRSRTESEDRADYELSLQRRAFEQARKERP